MGRKSKNKPVEESGPQPPNNNPSQPNTVQPQANLPVPQQSQNPQANQSVPQQSQQKKNQNKQQSQQPKQTQPQQQQIDSFPSVTASAAPSPWGQPASAAPQQKPQQQPQQQPQKQSQQIDSVPSVTASAAPSPWGQPAPSQQSNAGAQKQSAPGKSKNKYPSAKPAPAPVVEQQQQQQQPCVDNAATAVSEMNISPSKSSKILQIPIASAPNGKVFEGTRGERHQVEVNYLQILVDKLIPKAYHYDVTFEPDLPKKMLGRALEVFRVENFKTAHFAFDGRKNLYSNIMLNIGESFEKEVTVADEQRSKKFKVKLQLATEVDLSVLRNYQNPVYEKHDKPMQSLQALDIILRTAFKHAKSAVAAGRSLYFKPNTYLSLDEGMELWYGLFQSAILGRKALYLNVDVSHKAFPSQLSLLDLLASFDRQGRVPRSLDRHLAQQFEDALKMLELIYKLPGDKVGKLWRFNKLVGSARTQTFTTESGKKMTVEEYFKNEKKIQLKYPEMPLLHVGSIVRNIYLPLEFCEIPAGQATNKKCPPKCVAKMIKYSATSSDIRKKKIVELLSKIDYSSPEIQGFGLNVGKEFQKVEARVLKPPDIKYLRGMVKPNSGVWDGSRSNFLETQNAPIKWGLVNCDDYTKIDDMIRLKDDIFKAAERQNIRLERFDGNSNIRSINVMRSRPGEMEELFKKCVNDGMKFVIVLIIDRNDCYAQVKQAAELKVGILTQCIKVSTLQRMNGMTIGNILLKINAKLNGRNHEIVEESYIKMATQGGGVMFVGGDVTHPSPDQRNIPSVVGVAASYDLHGFRYNCSWRLQPPKMEMIKDFENILVDHLLFYKTKNGCFPRKIMYYRDGVSDGQFQEVLSLEMDSMKRACKRIYGNGPPAAITFIVVQKRHHTRFFPIDRKFSDGKNNNIKPGTVIDKDIVHPHQYQFFLASHAAIQGVTKPAKYCVLVNESKISPDDLQAITYDLCHLFTRCNRAVSYVAPTYYAHLVAARGKNYIIGSSLNITDLDNEFRKRLIRPEFIKNSPMFFV